jgi:hypothetical protein
LLRAADTEELIPQLTVASAKNPGDGKAAPTAVVLSSDAPETPLAATKRPVPVPVKKGSKAKAKAPQVVDNTAGPVEEEEQTGKKAPAKRGPGRPRGSKKK